MTQLENQILRTLDDCCKTFTFPMLDNGYVHLAASRMTLFRSDFDWAIAIEIFGFSPRSELPDISVSTFASRVFNRNSRENYVNENAYIAYLKNNPNNESRFYFPIEEGPWQDEENGELVAVGAKEVVLRGNSVAIPSAEDFEQLGIHRDASQRINVFNLCRALAANHRDVVLATSNEKRSNVPPDLPEIMVLDDWNHPNLAVGAKASDSDTFRQIAKILVTGDCSQYRPTLPGNTHWTNWPASGQL